MTENQKQIIRNYALYSDSNQAKFEAFLTECKERALSQVNIFKQECDNKIILEKIDNVKNRIQNLNTKPESDQEIIKFLTVSSLINELKGE